MTVTIELPPEIEAELIALADAQGLPLAQVRTASLARTGSRPSR
jgi:hypothetical protein